MKIVFCSILILFFLYSLSNAQAPTISNFTPASGPIGTAITITGTNFSTTPLNNIVYFGAARATVTGASSTQLMVNIPVGATYETFSIQSNGLTAYSSKPFMVVPANTIIDDCSFAPRTDFLTGSFPLGLAIADFDGDGKTDVAVASQDGILSIYRNTSTTGSINSTSFANPVNKPTGAGPYSIATDDLDGDGMKDIVVSNAQGTSISVFRNTSSLGAISFDDKIDFLAGGDPVHCLIHDLDGDGKPEILVVNRFNSLSIFKNNSVAGGFSAASFAFPVDFVTGIEPYRVAVSDFNADGKPDLAVANSVSGTVSVFENTSSTGIIDAGSFAAGVEFFAGDYPIGLTTDDVDGDGKNDMIVCKQSESNIGIFRNTGTGPITTSSFAPVQNFVTAANPALLYMTDLDGDAKADVVTSSVSTAHITVLKNISIPGSANFSIAASLPSGAYPTEMAIADLDGDKRAELISTAMFSDRLSVFQNLLGAITPPTITSFSPASGNAGTVVTITGTDFSTAFSTTVKLNGIPLTINSSTSTTLSVTIPTGATTGPLEVIIGCNTITSASNFTITGPTTIVISPQPISATVCEGSTASFSVNATGAANLSYQWQKVSSQAASLSALRWTIPSLAPENIDVDNAVDPATQSTTMGGVAGTTYSVTLRFRGVVETKNYTGGTTNGFWNAGGTPDAGGYNVYELNVSNPPAVYYLNAGSSDLLYCFPLDYQQTINIKAGATVQLKAEIRDGRILRNKDQFGNPIVVPAIDPAPLAFNGQFIQMDIVAIDGIGYTDVIDGGGYSGATTNTLNVNTSGHFGDALYRCKVSGDLTSDAFSDAAALTINSLPLSPTSSPNSGCSGTSIILSASGGSTGQYRWYDILTGGTPLAGAINSTYTTPVLSTLKTYYVTINNGVCESAPRIPVVVTVNPVPAQPTVISSITPTAGSISMCSGTTVTLTAPSGFTYLWSNNSTGSQINVSTAGSYSVVVTNTSGCSSIASSSISIIILPEPCSIASGELNIYTGISPNNDGKNDSWIIENIHLLNDTKNNKVSLYNRWGDRVFEVDNYDNTIQVFKGIGKNGDELPTATYFYKIEFISGRKTETGYLSLKR